MKSVFNTPPPKFSKEEASQIANDLFDIDIYTHDLVSDRDQNFLCISDKKKYILKISNPAEKHLVLEMQNEAVKFIKRNNSDLGGVNYFQEMNICMYLKMMRGSF